MMKQMKCGECQYYESTKYGGFCSAKDEGCNESDVACNLAYNYEESEICIVEHGKWIEKGLSNPFCNKCKSYNNRKSKYCTECGAIMNLGDTK